MQIEKGRKEPWVPNVRCQVCIFRPLWDRDDYHCNYSAFEQSVFCAEHWEAHLPWDLMLVFVCLSATTNIKLVGKIVGNKKNRESNKMRERVQSLQLN